MFPKKWKLNTECPERDGFMDFVLAMPEPMASIGHRSKTFFPRCNNSLKSKKLKKTWPSIWMNPHWLQCKCHQKCLIRNAKNKSPLLQMRSSGWMCVPPLVIFPQKRINPDLYLWNIKTLQRISLQDVKFLLGIEWKLHRTRNINPRKERLVDFGWPF